MEEKNRHILDNALQNLPQFKADDRIWDKIEEELDKAVNEKNADSLKKAIGGFPSFKAEEINWDKIEKGVQRPSVINVSYVYRIAASIILIAGLAFLFRNKFSKSEDQRAEVTFSKEVVPEEGLNIAQVGFEDEVNILIQQQCSVQPAVCVNPKFVELTGELSDLTQSLNNLKTTFTNSANDPEAYKYILRVEKEKAEISKKIIQYLNS